jgi:hypothetical protein
MSFLDVPSISIYLQPLTYTRTGGDDRFRRGLRDQVTTIIVSEIYVESHLLARQAASRRKPKRKRKRKYPQLPISEPTLLNIWNISRPIQWMAGPGLS